MNKERSIKQWVESCINAEEERGASASSVAEAGRHLRRAATTFGEQGITDVKKITPSLLRDYVMDSRQQYGPPTIKTMVWSLRKFGNFLVVQQVISSNPAGDLHHPKLSPRRNLPEYLSAVQLRQLMTTTAERRSLPDAPLPFF